MAMRPTTGTRYQHPQAMVKAAGHRGSAAPGPRGAAPTLSRTANGIARLDRFTRSGCHQPATDLGTFTVVRTNSDDGPKGGCRAMRATLPAWRCRNEVRG